MGKRQTIVFSDLFAVLQLCCNFTSHWSLQVLKKRSKYLKSSSKRRAHRVHGTISLQLRMMLHKWNLLQVNYRSKLPKICWQVAWCWRHSELAFSQLSAQCSFCLDCVDPTILMIEKKQLHLVCFTLSNRSLQVASQKQKHIAAMSFLKLVSDLLRTLARTV